MYDYNGKTALITGASSGIGEAFAKILAAKGMNLVLVARSEGKLQQLAAELERQHGVRVGVIPADLSEVGVAQKIYRSAKEQGWQVDLLVNNAGFSTYGYFETISPEREQAEITVNVASLVDLNHAFIPDMLEKGGGGVINVGSIGGFAPLTRQAVYGATKAFVLSFSQALHEEYRKRGLKVLALCPGAVATNFNEVIDVDINIKGATPEFVVKAALNAFERGKSVVVPGASNKLMAAILPRILPRDTVVRVMDRISKQLVRLRSPQTATKTAQHNS
jgi:uncharacterized protein